jgi:hypothetical protein
MKRISPRSTLPLSPSLDRRLGTYALAAGAAGVGMLALARPAEGKVVYTPAHIRIVVNKGFTELDLNHDGINDFQFLNIYGTHKNSTLNVAPAQNANRVWAASCSAAFHTSRCAIALQKGRTIGPGNPFQKGASSLLMAGYQGATATFGTYFGWWAKRTAYLGLKFAIKGKTHFGWARVKVNPPSRGFAATITGYAYETIANKPIVAGKTKGPGVEVTTLGRLALGSSGRRKQ